MPRKYISLNLEPELAEALRKIAEKQDIPITWSRLAKNKLWGYVAMHRARGNVE